MKRLGINYTSILAWMVAWLIVGVVWWLLINHAESATIIITPPPAITTHGPLGDQFDVERRCFEDEVIFWTGAAHTLCVPIDNLTGE